MAWTIAVVVVEDTSRSILVENAARLSTVELPDGDPPTELVVERIEALLPGLPPEDQAVWAGADAHWFRSAIAALDRGLETVDQRNVAG